MSQVSYQDAIVLLVAPLCLFTLIRLIKNFRSIFDAKLTDDDREILFLTALLVILPLVVVAHELGHVAAIYAFHGVVVDYHYSFLWGYVVPKGDFTDRENLIIQLAGNVVQIMIGFFGLFWAAIIDSPPVVALLVYVSIFSIGIDVVVYAVMSVLQMYSDWYSIYSSKDHQAVVAIAICHASLFVLTLWTVFGKEPRLWFARKTRPDWYRKHEIIEDRCEAEPTIDNVLALAWSFFLGGLDGQALNTIRSARKLGKAPELTHLESIVVAHQGKIGRAKSLLLNVAQSEEASDLLKARALVSYAKLCIDEVTDRDRRQIVDANGDILKNKVEKVELAQDALDHAHELAPDIADPLFYKGYLLNRLNMRHEAETELTSLPGLLWLEGSLKDKVGEELARASDYDSENESDG